MRIWGGDAARTRWHGRSRRASDIRRAWAKEIATRDAIAVSVAVDMLVVMMWETSLGLR
jgi:hypothetical protein